MKQRPSGSRLQYFRAKEKRMLVETNLMSEEEYIGRMSDGKRQFRTMVCDVS